MSKKSKNKPGKQSKKKPKVERWHRKHIDKYVDINGDSNIIELPAARQIQSSGKGKAKFKLRTVKAEQMESLAIEVFGSTKYRVGDDVSDTS